MSSTRSSLYAIIGRNSNASSKVTPPGSVNSSPLTPPASEKKFSCKQSIVVEWFRLAEECRLDNPWNVVDLCPGDYEQALKELALSDNCTLWSFVKHKLRYDYLPGPNPRLIIRMPCPSHEVFAHYVTKAIEGQLDRIKQKPEVSSIHPFVKDIIPGGSSNIKLDLGSNEGTYMHMPDSQFRHKEAQYPNVVIEISYSQKRKDLSRLADSYIVDSEGNIDVVIGLDIEYKGSRKATVTIWRSKCVSRGTSTDVELSSEEGECKVFRTDDGLVNQGGLCLRLKDFAPADINQRYDPKDLEQEIVVPYTDLADYLLLAEQSEHVTKGKNAIRRTYPGNVRKRKRDPTPPEELATEGRGRIRATFP